MIIAFKRNDPRISLYTCKNESTKDPIYKREVKDQNKKKKTKKKTKKKIKETVAHSPAKLPAYFWPALISDVTGRLTRKI